MVFEASARGLQAIGITDHDVVSGLSEANAAAPDGLEVVPGIEMTADWQAPWGRRAVHVLDEIRRVGGQLERADLDRYRHRYAGGAALVLGMVERGVLRNAPPGTGMRLLRLAAAEPRAYDVAEAVGLIHRAGGVASIAHPARLKRGQPLLEADDLRPLASLGFDALEAWQWIPGGWGSEHYARVAQALGLLVSGGSDDHGKRTSDGRMRLGAQPIDGTVLESLRERARAPRRA